MRVDRALISNLAHLEQTPMVLFDPQWSRTEQQADFGKDGR